MLVRWEHPKKGLIMPGRFISIFEKKGLIYQLDGWVWEQAIIQLKRWKDMGKEKSVSVDKYFGKRFLLS